MSTVLCDISPLWMSQHFSNFGCVFSLIVTFKFQLYPICSLLSLSEFCPARAQPGTHLGPEENPKHVSALLPALLLSLKCPVAQILDTSVSPNSDLWLLNLPVLLFSPWTHVLCPENSPRQKSGRTWFLFCAFLLSEGSQNCTAWYSMPQTGIVGSCMQVLTFWPVLYWWRQEGKSGTYSSIMMRSRSLSN